MKLFTGLAILTLLATAFPAAAGEVKAFPVKGVKLSRYQTYHWASIRLATKTGIVEDDPRVAPLIKQSVNRQLARKGYREVNDGGDLVILAAGLEVSSHQLEGFLLSWGYDVFWGYGVSTVAPVRRVNREGTLFVSFLDTKTEQSVWAGYATQALGRPGALGGDVDKAASRLFKKFPKRKK